jgi:hypothetical protein
MTEDNNTNSTFEAPIESVITEDDLKSNGDNTPLADALEHTTSAVALQHGLPPKSNSLIAYDYGQFGLDPAYAQELQVRAFRIHKHLNKTQDSCFEIGRDLKYVRDHILNYGDGKIFEEWVKVEFNMSKSTAYRFIGLYETLGGESFLSLRKAALHAETLYKLSSKRLPNSVRKEIATALENGEITGNTSAINAEVNRRIEIAEASGVGDSPAVKRAIVRKMRCRNAAVAAVNLLKAELSTETYREFERFAKIAGERMLFEAITVIAPHFVAGLISDTLINTSTKLPLTDDDLAAYLLERDSTPSSPAED